MIISASRRTDIPAFYPDWFLQRVKQGFVYVRNPRNRKQVSRISLRPEVIDGIVFWTKNASPLLQYLPELDCREYCYYVQFTVNSYQTDLEPNVPPKAEVLETFKRLSDAIGPERVIWRYDPILLSETYTVDDHIACFERFARTLEQYTRTCVISFVDIYQKIARRLKDAGARAVSPQERLALAMRLHDIASSCGLVLETCAEEADYAALGIRHGRCIDDALIGRLLGRTLRVGKDASQRLACGCVSSIDIGAYNTCAHGCKYCYATDSETAVAGHVARYNPLSPLLCADVGDDTVITERDMKQLSRAIQNELPF